MAQTPAGELASSFGDAGAMRDLYAPTVEWQISRSLGVPAQVGIDAVSAFNEQVWTIHHRPDCTVTILDEVGDAANSAVRFRYRAWSLLCEDWYENEYTLFIRSGPDGIVNVVEGFDSAAAIDFYARRPPGSGWAALDGAVGDGVEELGRSKMGQGH